MRKRERILAGVDLGPRSTAVLGSAWERARAEGALLRAVHCFDSRTLSDTGGSALWIIAALDEERARRLGQLETIAGEVLGGRGGCELQVQPGEPVSGLLQAISEWAPDLVVLGGRRERILPLCGVSERVSRLSPVPVLLVPWRVIEVRPAGRRKREDSSPLPLLRLVK